MLLCRRYDYQEETGGGDYAVDVPNEEIPGAEYEAPDYSVETTEKVFFISVQATLQGAEPTCPRGTFPNVQGKCCRPAVRC